MKKKKGWIKLSNEKKNIKNTQQQNKTNSQNDSSDEEDDKEKYGKKLKKNFNNQIKNKVETKIIDSFEIDKKFNFDKYNLNYSWENEDFITEFTKKKSI